MMLHSNIFSKIAPLPKQRVRALLAAGWSRVIANVGIGSFADVVESSTNTVGNALALRTTPELHTALNSLAVDPTALDELLAGYGLRIMPLHNEAANDLVTLSGVCGVASEWAAAMQDGRRDHNETLRLADNIRPLLPALTAVVREADALRGAA